MEIILKKELFPSKLFGRYFLRISHISRPCYSVKKSVFFSEVVIFKNVAQSGNAPASGAGGSLFFFGLQCLDVFLPATSP